MREDELRRRKADLHDVRLKQVTMGDEIARFLANEAVASAFNVYEQARIERIAAPDKPDEDTLLDIIGEIRGMRAFRSFLDQIVEDGIAARSALEREAEKS